MASSDATTPKLLPVPLLYCQVASCEASCFRTTCVLQSGQFCYPHYFLYCCQLASSEATAPRSLLSRPTFVLTNLPVLSPSSQKLLPALRPYYHVASSEATSPTSRFPYSHSCFVLPSGIPHNTLLLPTGQFRCHVPQSGGTLLSDTLVGILTDDTLAQHSCDTCATLSSGTLVGHSCRPLLWGTTL